MAKSNGKLARHIFDGLAVVGALTVIAAVGGVIVAGVVATRPYRYTAGQSRYAYESAHAYRAYS